MTRICFSQNFEDVVLWRALGHVTNGRYLDVGAQHPSIDSVSRSFYLAGWRGVHVEPVPAYADAIRADRPDEVVIQAAVGKGTAPIVIHAIEGTGLSTGDPEIAAAHAAAGHPAVPIKVPQISLASLLDRFIGSDLHWLKIDVEGMEAEVLASWEDSTVRPWVVLVEAIDPTTNQATDAAWRSHVESRGYHEVLFDGVSRFFVADERPELDASFAAPANCLDDFMMSWHHWICANAVDLFEHQLQDAQATAQSSEAEREKTWASLQEALNHGQRIELERDYLSNHLDDLRSERVVLTRAVSQLGEELSMRRIEVDRLRSEWLKAEEQKRSLADQLHSTREEAFRLEASEAEQKRSLARLSKEFDELKEVRNKLEGTAASQAARLANAERIAALAATSLQSSYTPLLSGFSKRFRRHRADLQNALHRWSATRYQSTDDGRDTREDGTNPMDLFAYDRRDPYHRVDSLEELCRFADCDFVRCAFVTILGRQPDPDGEEYYLKRVRAGDSMLSIIWALRNSDEGQRHDPGIAGLDRELRKHRNANRPLVGWLVRLFTGREGNSPAERRLRIVSNMLGVEHKVSGARAAMSNHMQVTILQRIDVMEKQLKAALSGQAMTSHQIAQAEASGDEKWEDTLTSVLGGR